jgi:hypothetical protein
MKNHRGGQFAAIKLALFSVFGVERLPRLKNNYTAADVVEWKCKDEMISCYHQLFERNSEGLFCVIFIVQIETVIYTLIFLLI